MADSPASAVAAPSAEGASTAPEAPAQPVSDTPEWKRTKHKVKVDGQEAEIDYDELVTGYQVRKASDARMREAAATQKKLMEAWNASDPHGYFKAKNVDPEKWAEDILIKKLKLQSMTPEERSKFDQDQKDADERRQEKEELEQMRQEKKQHLVTQAVQRLDGEIVDAFKAIGTKPEPALVKRMSEIMEAYMDTHDGEMIPASKALEQVLKGRNSETLEYLQSLSADKLRDVLPKKLLDELRRHDVELVRSQSPLRGQSRGAETPTPKSKTVRKSTEALFRDLETKFG